MTKRPILSLSKDVSDEVRAKLAQHIEVQDEVFPETAFDASYTRDIAAANKLRRATRQGSTSVHARAGETVDNLGERLNDGGIGPLPVIE